MQYKTVYLLFCKFTLCVSGVNHNHHQEYKNLLTTASGTVQLPPSNVAKFGEAVVQNISSSTLLIISSSALLIISCSALLIISSSALLIISSSALQGIKNDSEISCKKSKHILRLITSVFEIRAVYEIMWKNIIVPDRPQIATWRVRIACWIQKLQTQAQFE